MFNIIHSGGKKKVHNTWWNADLISKKYGISVRYLTEQSYFCQLNHGASNFDPYKSSYQLTSFFGKKAGFQKT
ncbi:hypothetical protein PTTG_08395 [Puccinia triticina 1-1 BBBD Race 1]|uniref:DUF7872 domain-containing protein n=1 Tax=Puccinia triticina (isolate 1-1 / race 1 (BBBD)) TaxID=630390 RepID=A0A0C4F5J5_PUCT1|nr:hypothetical protein PTTG_08395 [Puccinia triticina 1-1 BBBD Race 1]